MNYRKNLLHKLFLSGILLLFIPLIVFVSLVVMAFWQLKFIHKDYGKLVSDLKTDIETVDKEILGYKSNLNKNQIRTKNINHKLSLRIMKKEMKYAAVKLSMQLGNYMKNYNQEALDIYFKTFSDQTAANISSNQKSGKSSINNVQTGKKLKTSKNRKKPEEQNNKQTEKNQKNQDTKEKTKSKLSGIKLIEKQFNNWCTVHKTVLTNELAIKIEKFAGNVDLGLDDRALFIVEHSKLNDMRILWSTKPEWQFKNLASVAESFYDTLVSNRYSRRFLKFQNKEAEVPVIYSLVYPQNMSFTDAKYQISKQNYWGLIPIFGTNLSLGIFTPLNSEVFQTLDSVEQNLGKISNYLGKTSTKLRKTDVAITALGKRFKTEIVRFNHILIFVIIIMIIFLVIVGYLVLRNLKEKVITPILHITEVANRIENGEYDVRTNVKTNDEIEALSRSINAMLDTIVKYIQTEEVQTAIQKDIITMLEIVSQAAKGDLTARGEVVTDDLQAVMDAFNHMMLSIGAMVVSVKKSGSNVDEMANRLLENLNIIKDSNVLQATTVDITSRKIKALGDRSQEISRMLDQIDAIITDTNNLAFNVSLEAAKLDEKSLGISHLVDNVNRLVEALRTTKKDISSLVGTIQMSSSYAEQSMHEVINITSETLQKMEVAHEIAQNTVKEANELINTISVFKIKTEEDLEYEKKLMEGLKNLAFSIDTMAKIVRKMNTSEYSDLLTVLDRFSKNIKAYDMTSNANEMFRNDSAAMSNDSVPAIISDENEDEDLLN